VEATLTGSSSCRISNPLLILQFFCSHYRWTCCCRTTAICSLCLPPHLLVTPNPALLFSLQSPHLLLQGQHRCLRPVAATATGPATTLLIPSQSCAFDLLLQGQRRRVRPVAATATASAETFPYSALTANLNCCCCCRASAAACGLWLPSLANLTRTWALPLSQAQEAAGWAAPRALHGPSAEQTMQVIDCAGWSVCCIDRIKRGFCCMVGGVGCFWGPAQPCRREPCTAGWCIWCMSFRSPGVCTCDAQA
jgi:hypothetical protein